MYATVVQCTVVKCGPDSRKLQYAFFNVCLFKSVELFSSHVS